MSREHDTPLRRADPNPTLDALTGLANRDEILATITAALVDLGPDQHFSVLLVDIDGFREFNDALGPAQGDELLCMVADRLTASTRPGDTIGITIEPQGGSESPTTEPIAAIQSA